MSSGSRPGARKVVLLVSDGDANVAADETIPAAVRLKNEGQAVVMAVAVSQLSFINENVLKSVVSRPTHAHIFNTASYLLLPNITDQLINATCNGINTGWTRLQ